MNLSRWSVKRPVGIFMVVAMVIVLGITSVRNLAIDLYPDMELPIAAVTTSYQGTAPEDIEETVTTPLEESLGTIDGVDTIQSQSSSGSSMVLIQFDFGTDLDQAMLDMRESVDGASSALPDGADEPSVMRFDPDQQAMMMLGFSGDNPEEVKELAEDRIQPQLEQGNGVASASIEGLQSREIQVQLNVEELNRYELTPDDVINSLGAENQTGSAGNVESGSQDIQLRVDGEFQSINDIENTIIPRQEGGTVHVQDVADVVDTVEEDSSKTFVNGETAYMFSIMKQSDANTVEVSQNVKEIVAELNEEVGDSAELNVVSDSAEFIETSIDSVVNNLIFGALFAVLVLLAFLRSVRATLVIGISIPIAVIATFSLMYFTGETLNILTMGGLALGVGMMVDSAIVILESIYKHIEEGKTRKEAAIAGAQELGSAVIASTVTTLVVFLPIVFVEGIASELFAPLALTVGFALIASLLAALTIVPMLASKLIKEEASKTQEDNRFTRIGNAVNGRYHRMLKWSIGHRKTVLSITGLLIVGSLALVPMIGGVLLPDSDEGEIMIEVETPTASTSEETQTAVDQVWTMLEPYEDDIDSTYSTVGSGSSPVGGGSNNQAVVNLSLVNSSDREIETSELVSELSEQTERIPGAQVSVSDVTTGAAGGGSPITVSLSGQEVDVLDELAEEIEFAVEQVPGTTGVDTSSGDGNPQIDLDVDRDQASQYGLSYQDIMSQVMTAFNGQVATEYREEGQEIDVQVIFPNDAREQISDIRNMTLTAANGSGVSLAAIADLNETTGPTQISREDQQRQVDITSDVTDRTLSEVAADVEEEVSQMNIPDGYSVSYGGDSEEMQEAFGNLALAMIASIFLVYAVMAIQFESFVQPFVIMFSLPATLIGVLVGLFITQTPLSITAFIGLIMLAGIVVNNAIVLVDYINQRREAGEERDEAILAAGPARLRPIMMTVLTTVLAMLPIALGLGEGAEAQAPMAIVIIFGLAFSTLFTLILIPVVYAVTDNMVLWFKKKKDKIGKKKEDTVSEEM
ncbi:efflux RND transporter permease subunit [Salibacterium salarium]|uniref:Efflux RND transporter permease subunit n=1 Tax=Salibacterium salarium TaxID=284579 RepID=A0A428N412_9BACI|nr:efflux RND transporter permease subunit [Salibacterium salarium]RSL33076.1 efflux RND transporter permease subunit [Salibacterium salarium]